MSRKLVVTLVMLATAAPVAAQPEHRPGGTPDPGASRASAPAQPAQLAIEIAAPPGALDGEAVRAAVAAELGVEIVDGAAGAAPALGRLQVIVQGEEMRVIYARGEAIRIERKVAMPASGADRTQMIAFVAANVVADQAGTLLAELATRGAQEREQVGAAATSVAVATERPVEQIATLGLVPPLSVDRLAGRRVIVGSGLHVLVGVTEGSRYVSIAGLVDRERAFATGVQIGGIGASAGRVDGVQLGGGVAVAGGDTAGVQIGGIGAISGSDVRGVQIGGVAAIAKDVRGVQIGGVATVARDVQGVQVGLVNVARRVRGVQIGLVNVMEDGDDAYPIGLINLARNGSVEMEGWAESTRLSAMAVRFGPRHLHNVWALGWSPDHEHVLPAVGLGFRGRLGAGATLDVDAMNWWPDVWHGHAGQLEQLRVTVAYPVGPIEVIGGASANVYIGSDAMDESAHFHPVLARTDTSAGGTRVTTWPSAFAGIRVAR